MFPKVSIVMPSFNQVEFIERSILSVLNQSYSNVELIVIDGGSTDGSVEIIKSYADKLAYWVSEPDEGQAQAINKGISQATGEWIGWQNSDDLFSIDAIQKMVERAQQEPLANLVIGDMCLIDANDQRIRDIKYVAPSYRSILAEGMVLTNQSALWQRSIHSSIGYLNESLHYGFDYEWFLRVLEKYRAVHVAKVLGYLRIHDQTKSSLQQPEFKREYDLILAGRGVSVLTKKLYKLRRYATYLLRGQFTYLREQIRYGLTK
ncbi:glycosyltransferase [Polynucleobacter ibericus]|nr:glycosyltransferase [Polynucleobacter ibericus]